MEGRLDGWLVSSDGWRGWRRWGRRRAARTLTSFAIKMAASRECTTTLVLIFIGRSHMCIFFLVILAMVLNRPPLFSCVTTSCTVSVKDID